MVWCGYGGDCASGLNAVFGEVRSPRFTAAAVFTDRLNAWSLLTALLGKVVLVADRRVYSVGLADVVVGFAFARFGDQAPDVVPHAATA